MNNIFRVLSTVSVRANTIKTISYPSFAIFLAMPSPFFGGGVVIGWQGVFCGKLEMVFFLLSFCDALRFSFSDRKSVV